MSHSLSEAIAVALDDLRNSIAGANHLEGLVTVIVALAVLRLEVMRRTGSVPQQAAVPDGGSYVSSCKKVLQQYAPEFAGLVACLALAVGLRYQASGFHMVQAAPDDTVASIMREWPLLLTADTLLAFQAMLRLLVLVSSVLRARGGPSLLSQEAAAISLGAAVGRAALLARTSDYMLDGPIGGYLPAVCELVSVPLLAMLCAGLHQRALTASILTLATSAWIGSRNHLNLSGDGLSNGLFIFVHTAELLAAFAYLSRALLSDVGPGGCGRRTVALHFAHVVMPLQQCLSAYYFVQAFPLTPELVGAGHPFEILQMAGVAQVGAYVGAAVLHMAEYMENPAEIDMPLGSEIDVPRHFAVTALF